MTTIAGVFDNKIMADQAVAELLNAGFTKDDISLIMTENTKNTLFSSTDDEANRTAKGASTGAALGGALGALVAGLTTAGALVTGGGALLISGPIVAVLSGLGAGAVAGGFAGALIQAGFAADEANRFEKELERGKSVVLVHADSDGMAASARSALQHCGAIPKAA
jgi:hypothetical protein